MAAQEVTVTLSTLAGASHDLALPVTALALQGKSWAADLLGRPADLQRWLVNGSIVEDGDLLASFKPTGEAAHTPLQVLCVFLPRTFDVKVKLVKFSPGSQAQSAEEFTIAVSPMMTIDAAKFEALSAVCAEAYCNAARLIKGGLHLEDEQTVEHYHIDPESMLHLVIPRTRGGDGGWPAAIASEVADNISGDSYKQDAAWRKSVELSQKQSGKEAHTDEIIKTSKSEEESLSPRSRKAASMFSAMGVHRVRPRRAASTPAFKPRERNGCAEHSHNESNSTSSTRCGTPQSHSTTSADSSPRCDANFSVESLLDVPVLHHQHTVSVESLLRCSTPRCDAPTFADAAVVEEVVPVPSEKPAAPLSPTGQPQKPTAPRETPSRPHRESARPSSRCARRSPAGRQPRPSPQSPLGCTRPPTSPVSPVGATRPPTMPAAAYDRPVSCIARRPVSRDAPHPVSRNAARRPASCDSARPVSRDSARPVSREASVGATPRGGCSLSVRPQRSRSSSIDRWHFVAQIC